MENTKTFSVDLDMPLIGAIQFFIDLWANSTNDYEQRNKAINLIAELINEKENPTEFVATFKASHQISPDDFQVYNPSLKIDSNERISTVMNFYKKYDPNGVVEVKLIQLQK